MILAKDRERIAKTRANKTPAEKEVILAKGKKRDADRRANKKRKLLSDLSSVESSDGTTSPTIPLSVHV